MKTESKKQEKCQVKLTITLDAEEVKASVGLVEKTFMREAQIPGFRKGKVPLAIIRKDFAASLKEEIQRDMVRRYYADAVKAEKLEEIGLLGVESTIYDDNGGTVVVIVEVQPEFKLPTYKGLKIKFEDAKVDEKEVQDQLNRLRVAYAKFEDAKEGDVVADGDFVQIDYEGMIGKKKILEINPDAKIVGKGEGFWTQVDEGRFLPEILDAVKGMKAGETKEDIKVKFSKDGAPEGIAGEKAVYTLTLKSFRRRILPTDAEFLEKSKSESIEKMTETIRTTMENAAVEQEKTRRENQAIELLLKKVDFEVPQSQVGREMEGYLREFAQRAQYSGLDADYFEKNREKILKEVAETATRQVRLWYVLKAIATAEKIEAKDEEIGRKAIDFVLANAKK